MGANTATGKQLPRDRKNYMHTTLPKGGLYGHKGSTMKRCVITLIAVCVLGMVTAGVAPLIGCRSHSASEHWLSVETGMPVDFVWADNHYLGTDVTVARQDINASMPSNLMYIGSALYMGGERDVYVIEGLDENEAIALKMGRAGGYTYFKYERVYGQEEPADFVYEGGNYAETGEIINIERASVGIPEDLSYLASVIYQGTTYDVYSIHIQGEDNSQAIALRIAKAGKTVGFYNYYFKYEKQ